MMQHRVYRFDDGGTKFVLADAVESRETPNVIECMSEWVVERDEDPLPYGSDTGLAYAQTACGRIVPGQAFYTAQSSYIALYH